MFKSPKVSYLSVVLVICLVVSAWAGPCPPGDLDENCKVDFNDFAILASQWFGEPNQPSANIAPYCGDNEVNFLDLDLLTEDWLKQGTFLTNIIFPGDAGVVDVTKSPYNAYGDGVHDDTTAIQNALNDNVGNIVYLPNGTYIISDMVSWSTGYSSGILQGQSTLGTIIKLQDSCSGYGPSDSKTVVKMGTSGGDDFRNYVRNLTIDTGTGNPGATGLYFHSNNNGAVVDVIIRSGDGQGRTGLTLTGGDNGPLLIKNVKIVGFNTGIATSGAVNSQTFEHIILKNQSQYGFNNNGQVVSIRGLVSYNQMPAAYNSNSDGVMTLIDCKLTGYGDANSEQAVSNNGTLFARNLCASGYKGAINNSSGHGKNAVGPYVDEFVSHNPRTLWNVPSYSLNLPIKETPTVPWDQDFNDWANVKDYPGATDTQKIQAAIDANKTTVYFPKDTYSVSGTIEIKGKVRRLVGCDSQLNFSEQAVPVLKMVNGSNFAPVVVIDQLNFDPDVTATSVDNASSRTLVLKHCKAGGGTITGTGDVFYEDVISGRLRQFVFTGGQNVWARHLGVETRNDKTHVINDGSTLWILGYKTENAGILVETKNGGDTEVLGHFAYMGMMSNTYPLYPMYDVNESSMSATMGGAHYSTYDKIDDLVRETQGGITRKVLRTDATLPDRGGLKAIPLYVGRHTAPSSAGSIHLDKEQYVASETVNIYLMDIDLQASSTKNVTVTSSGGDSETVTLSDDPNNSGIFNGSIATAEAAIVTEDGTLQVWHGYTITATYQDANDGTGSPATAEDTATVTGMPVILCETDFTGGCPGDWTIIDGYSDGNTWNSNNPHGYSSGYWNGEFMVVSYGSAAVDMNEQLITPGMDCSSYEDITLEFNHDFWPWVGESNEVGDVDISVDGGSWQNLLKYQEPDGRNSGRIRLDISSIAAGHSNVKIRWHYYNAHWERVWGIDDVLVVTYAPPP